MCTTSRYQFYIVDKMKLFFLFFFLAFNTFSQSEDPTFPGGLDGLYSWVVRNTVYPIEAGDNNEYDNEIDPSLLLGEWIFCTNDTNYYFDSKTMSDTTVFYKSTLNSLAQKCSFVIKIGMYKKDNVSLLDITAVEQGIELSEKNLPYSFNKNTNILSVDQKEVTFKFKVKSLSIDKMTLRKL